MHCFDGYLSYPIMTQKAVYRVDSSSPQSQSSYSPQNSPHLLASPISNEHNLFSPQPSTDTQQGPSYCTSPNHFDQTHLVRQTTTNIVDVRVTFMFIEDNGLVYVQQQQPPSIQDLSSAINTILNDDDYFHSNEFYMPFINDL
jgi:hypothetical protein